MAKHGGQTNQGTSQSNPHGISHDSKGEKQQVNTESATCLRKCVSFSNLGDDLYQTLLTLFSSTSHAQTYTTADDDRIVANGIQVRRHVNQDGCPVLDLVGLSQVMPLYGLRDLVEILDLICNTKATSLSMARPLKVINYLQVS